MAVTEQAARNEEANTTPIKYGALRTMTDKLYLPFFHNQIISRRLHCQVDYDCNMTIILAHCGDGLRRLS